MIAIIDYGMGNLRSVQKAFEYLGYEAVITDEVAVIAQASHVILPGVGAFEDAMKRIRETGLDQALMAAVEGGKPVLGICLGMQMMFEYSEENGYFEGLGLFPGTIIRFNECGLKIPHMGWNSLSFPKESPLFKGIDDGSFVYFVHSYYAAKCNDILATTDYGAELTAAVAKDNIMGCQFHPEKSGEVGLNILKAFCEWEG